MSVVSITTAGWDRLEIVVTKHKIFLELADAFAARFIHHLKSMILKQARSTSAPRPRVFARAERQAR